MEPMVSGCLAVHNGADLLPRALASMRDQTRPCDEIIVVDDGSTDESADIAESFGARVIRQANTGIGAARRRLVEEARGDWIAFCDHDDWWEPEKIKRLLPATRDPEVSLIYSGAYLVDEHGNRLVAPMHASPTSPRLRHLLPHQDNILVPATLIRRQTLIDAGGFSSDLRIGEDTHAFYLLASRGKIAQIPEPLACIFKRSDSTSAFSKALFEHEDRLYDLLILAKWHELFAFLPPDEQAEAQSLIKIKLSHIKSILGVWRQWEGEHAAAMMLHRQAIALNPRSKGNWYRFAACALGRKVKPVGA